MGAIMAVIYVSSTGNQNSMTHPGHDHRFGHWIPASAGMTGEKVVRHSRESGNMAVIYVSSTGNQNSMPHPGHDHRFGHWIPASAGMTGEKVVRHSRESGNLEGYELPFSSTSHHLDGLGGLW